MIFLQVTNYFSPVQLFNEVGNKKVTRDNMWAYNNIM